MYKLKTVGSKPVLSVNWNQNEVFPLIWFSLSIKEKIIYSFLEEAVVFLIFSLETDFFYVFFFFFYLGIME